MGDSPPPYIMLTRKRIRGFEVSHNASAANAGVRDMLFVRYVLHGFVSPPFSRAARTPRIVPRRWLRIRRSISVSGRTTSTGRGWHPEGLSGIRAATRALSPVREMRSGVDGYDTSVETHGASPGSARLRGTGTGGGAQYENVGPVGDFRHPSSPEQAAEPPIHPIPSGKAAFGHRPTGSLTPLKLRSIGFTVALQVSRLVLSGSRHAEPRRPDAFRDALSGLANFLLLQLRACRACGARQLRERAPSRWPRRS